MKNTTDKSEYCDNIKLNDYFHIQDFGALVIINVVDFKVLSVSENIHKICSLDTEMLLNKNICEFLDDESAQFIHLIKEKRSLNPISKLVSIINGSLKEEVVVSAYITGSYMIIEIEPFVAEESDHDKIFELSIMSESLNSAENHQDVFNSALSEIRDLTGYHSIMIYQYQNEDYGKVIYHYKDEGVFDYTNHCFPASDTPKQVRNLFLRRLARYIPNIEYCPSNLKGVLTKEDVDISASGLKGVVPIHLTYLENIGSKAAISVPIIIDGELWGLIACHHNKPKYLSVRKRKLLTIISSLVSLSFVSIKREQDKLLQKSIISSFKDFYKVHDASPNEQIVDSSPVQWLSELTQQVKFDGIVYCINDSCTFKGTCLSINEAKRIYQHCKELKGSNKIFYLQNDELTPFLNESNTSNNIKSIALLMINSLQNIFLILYRIGAVELLKWAGNPSTVNIDDTKNLSQRNSFEIWQEEHKNTALAWTESEKLALEQIQVLLAEKTSQQQLAEQAYYDQLTGLYNRHFLEDAFNRSCKIAKRRNVPLCICIIDIDYFKTVNDDYGHDVGDKVLIEVSKQISGSYRAEDVVCRYGGEEFVIMMLGVHLRNAIKRSESLRKKLQNYDIELNGQQPINITLSAGVFAFSPSEQSFTLEEAIKEADDKLYDAKESGRNKVLPKLES